MTSNAASSGGTASRKLADADSVPSKDGQWSPLVKLKDLTFLFPGTHERPRPDGGWFVTPIAANLLRDGRVLITGWSRAEASFCEWHKGRQNGETFVLDPQAIEAAGQTDEKLLAIQPIDEKPKVPGDVLYCAGYAPYRDGRILLTGGARYENLDFQDGMQEYGLNYARVFEPKTGQFTRVEQPSPAGPHPSADELKGEWSWYEQGMMWYPTNTRLPDGRFLVAGGFARQEGPLSKQYYNKSLAFFDFTRLDRGQDPWQTHVSDGIASDAMQIGPFDYPKSFLLPRPIKNPAVGGVTREFVTTGGGQGTLSFVSLDAKTPEAARMITPPGARRLPGTDGHATHLMDTNAALLPTGELLFMGGGAYGAQESARIDVYDPRADHWQVFDSGITRIRGASILLPDGTVLILSGEGMWDDGGKPYTVSVGDRRRPTIFDPFTRQFRNLAPWTDDPNDRGYHNLALLLKDGRVLVGGGRTLVTQNGVEEYRIGCERTDLRIFSPPYLFRGDRPVLGSGIEGRVLQAGGPALELFHSGPSLRKVGGVVLMAMGAETHHFDQNQRYVKLDFTEVAGGRLAVSPPANLTVAPPGEYVLYLLSENGVPSRGVTVRVEK